MGCILEGFLWAWIILESGVCSVTLPEITDRKFIDEYVKEHNRARSSVSLPASNMLHMQCKTALWVDKKQHYDYNSQGCTNVCGHYTQVVWASSYKVGCAAHLCPNGVKGTHFGPREGVVFECNYAPVQVLYVFKFASTLSL
nr:glioma pathogenesis-related protein 1-like [Labrus bergylta]